MSQSVPTCVSDMRANVESDIDISGCVGEKWVGDADSGADTAANSGSDNSTPTGPNTTWCRYVPSTNAWRDRVPEKVWGIPPYESSMTVKLCTHDLCRHRELPWATMRHTLVVNRIPPPGVKHVKVPRGDGLPLGGRGSDSATIADTLAGVRGATGKTGLPDETLADLATTLAVAPAARKAAPNREARRAQWGSES
jgi:hypothetical protein